jgi:hypothetical protein
VRRSKLLRIIGAVLVVKLLIWALVVVVLRLKMRSAGDETSDEIALAAAANGIELRSRAAAFRGGTAKAILGGLELDLSEATLAPEGGRLEVETILGGAEILVPDSWRIRFAPTRTLLGGVEYPHDLEALPSSDEPELELALHAVLGGIEVKQKAPDAANGDATPLLRTTDA